VRPTDSVFSFITGYCRDEDMVVMKSESVQDLSV